MNQTLATTRPSIAIDGYLGDLSLPGIDWAYFLERRQGTLEAVPDLPAYLLLPEVERLLAATHHQVHHFLINTLMHTGARISEALLLTRDDFRFDGRYPEISIPTLKQRRGRPSNNGAKKPKRRLIPVLDGDYLDEALRYFASNPGGQKALLFDIDRSTAFRWIKAAVARLAAQGQPLSIEVSPHTLRHSFAVNAVLNWVPVPVLQTWLGHENRESTEIYTQVFQTETVHFMSRVSYKSGMVYK